MAHTTELSPDTNSPNVNTYKQLNPVRMHLFTLFAAFTGVVIGVLASVGFVSTYIHGQLAQQTASLSHQIVQLRDAALYNSSGSGVCVAPSSTSGSGAGGLMTAAAVTGSSSTPASGGKGGGSGNSSTTFIKKLVGGNYVNNTAKVSNTGPDSTNTVSFQTSNTTTVNNTNSFSYSNSNNQHATSGDAEVDDNTTGGNATSGDATNTNVNNVTYKVEN